MMGKAAMKNEENEVFEECTERLLLALRNFSRTWAIHSKYILKRFNVTSGQLMCLRVLDAHSGLSVGAIARQTLISPATITGIIDRLEAKDLVKRCRATRDRRVINIEITDKGRALVEAAPVPIQSLLKAKLKNMPLEELKAATDTVEKLQKFIETEEVEVMAGELPVSEEQAL